MNENSKNILKSLEAKPDSEIPKRPELDPNLEVSQKPQLADSAIVAPAESAPGVKVDAANAITAEQILESGNSSAPDELKPLETEEERLRALEALLHDGTDGREMIEGIEKAKQGLQ